MKILVTGGTGFQGSNLSKALIEAGHEVTIFNTHSERSEVNVKRFGLDRANIIWGSITDQASIDKVCREKDVVFHLAANVHVDESIREPWQYMKTNIFGTYNVAEACRKYNLPLILVSTCETYGGCEYCEKNQNCDHLIKEFCPLKPQSPYASSKAAADRIVFAHGITYGFPFVIVRPFNIYGIGQRYGTRGAVIPIFVKQAIENQDITVYGDGYQGRDFVYVKDLVKAYILIMDRFLDGELKNEVVNVGSGKDITVNELATRIKAITHSGSKIKHFNGRDGEVTTFKGDSGKLFKLGFNFDYSIQQGLVEYIEWFKEFEM